MPGDTLLIATDGVLEAADKSGVEFGLERLESVLRNNSNQLLSALVGKIQATLSASYRQDDDQSLLLVRFAKS
jgi:sigma-B regulation protein RsbU (phosphoserine phosphatase)